MNTTNMELSDQHLYDISFLQVAWLHSEKGTLAVHPSVITQNDRVSVSHDSRETYNLRIADIQGDIPMLFSFGTSCA